MAGADELQIGLIGYGLGGGVFHAPLIEATEGMTLASIVTSDPERQARARDRYPRARIFDRSEQLWDAADSHSLAVVCTPNRSHVPLGLAALDAGLPIVVDKPLAPNSTEAEKLVATAVDKGLLFSVFQNRRWDGDFLTVKRLIAEGAMGRITRFESRYERWRPEPDLNAWRERSAPEEAGGLLFDLGSHLVDQALVLFGKPTHVYAEGDRRRARVEVDDDSFVALTHADGVRTHLWMSVLARLLGPRFRVLGSKGAFEKHGLDPQEEALAVGEIPGASTEWGTETSKDWGTLATDDDKRKVRTEPGSYQSYYAGVAKSLRTGAPPPVDPRDSVLGLRVLETAMRSALSGNVEHFE